MSVATIPELNPDDSSVRYSRLFRRYLAGALRQSLDHVQRHRFAVPEDVRVQAWHVLRLTLDIDDLWEQTSRLLIALAPRMHTGGIWNEWLPYLRQGIVNSSQVGDQESEANLLLALGTLLRRQSKYDEAEALLLSAQAIWQRLNSPNDEALALNELALQCQGLRQFQQATELAQAALALFDSNHPERANSYFILGFAQSAYGNWDEAQTYVEEALHIRLKQDNRPRIVNNLVKLADIERQKGNYHVSRSRLAEAIELLQEVDAPVQRAEVYNALGITYSLSGEPEKAVELYQSAEAIYQQAGHSMGLTAVYTNLGLDNGLLENWALGEHYLKRSITIAQETNEVESCVNAMIELTNLYQKQALWMQADSTLQEASELLESIPDDPRYDLRKSEIAEKMTLNQNRENR